MIEPKHVAVLMGGTSAEREVSLNSGAACARALEELGHKVTTIDVGDDIAEVLGRVKPDVAFNALHGRFGEDGCMQGLLEMMHIPYTHSGVLASSVAMDKPMAKVIFTAAGLRCPKGMIVSRASMLEKEPMKRPYVVKPANEGSSVGVVIMQESDNRTLAMALPEEAEDEHWMVEEYIPGREITVAVLNNHPIGVTEIRPLAGFYDYTNKYTDGKTEHLCPAPLEPKEYDEVMAYALAAHKALGCKGLTRSDFRFDGKHFYILEINTQPGMTALSLSPEIAAHAGISFKNLVQMLIEDAHNG